MKLHLAALEATLDDDPDDQATLSVYADALLEAGDPRGELAAIQRARATADSDHLADRERALLARHGDALLGAVADPDLQGFELTWAMGHVRSIVLAEPLGAKPSAADVLRDLLARPAGRWITEIAVERPRGYAAELLARWRQVDRGIDAVKAIAAAPRPALRELSFGQREIPFDAQGDDHARDLVSHAGDRLGDLRPLWAAAPRLRGLLLSGCHATLGAVELHELERLEIRSSLVPREILEALGHARLPSLRWLALWLGAADYGRTTYSPGSLAPLFDPVRFPALEHLGLVCAADTAAVVQQLARSPLAARLRSLDLSGGTLRTLRGLGLERMARLEQLDVRWNPGVSASAHGELEHVRILDQPQRAFVPDLPRFNACQE